MITIGALLGMAAHLEGRGCSVLDFTGMAQKNGAVTSHVRIALRPEDLHAVRVGTGAANVVIGCDMIVAASPSSLSRMEPGVTRAVINGTLIPTARFVVDRDMDMKFGPMQRALRTAAGADAVEFVAATEIATALMGDGIASNLFLLGYAFQKGLIPLELASLERAIELNGTAVDSSKAAFAWGRVAAHDSSAVARASDIAVWHEEPAPPTREQLIVRHVEFLTAYQDAAYAERYRRLVARVAAADDRIAGQSGLTEAAARSLFKVMAYKDEYEVARLHAGGDFLAKLRKQFDGDAQLQFHLAPPLFARRDPATGEPRKRAYGGWMLHAFRALAPLKRLRGTPFDPFGRTAERYAERKDIVDFERTLETIIGDVDVTNYVLAVEIATLPQSMRGFGHIKERNRVACAAKQTALLAQFRRDLPVAHAAD